MDGFVCNEKERCRVTLRKPVPISDVIEIIPINDADIILKHDDDTYYFQLDTNGIYYSVDSIMGIAGETYSLEIHYHGRNYYAQEIMPYEPNDEFNLPFRYMPAYEGMDPLPWNVKFGFIEVPIHNFGYDKMNIWTFFEPLYVDPHLQRSIIHLLGRIFTHQGSVPQGIFPPMDVFISSSGMAKATDSIEIVKSEISDRYNQYLLDKFNETSWQGQMFSTIPGNLQTNLSEGAVGYFYALNVKRKRFMIKILLN